VAARHCSARPRWTKRNAPQQAERGAFNQAIGRSRGWPHDHDQRVGARSGRTAGPARHAWQHATSSWLRSAAERAIDPIILSMARRKPLIPLNATPIASASSACSAGSRTFVLRPTRQKRYRCCKRSPVAQLESGRGCACGNSSVCWRDKPKRQFPRLTRSQVLDLLAASRMASIKGAAPLSMLIREFAIMHSLCTLAGTASCLPRQGPDRGG